MADKVKVRNGFHFQLGCDPELFLADAKGNLKSSVGLIGGSKEQPQPIPVLGEGFAVQEDNVAIEFNIPPASNMREFVDNVSRTMKVLNDGVHASLGFHIVNMSAASFPEEELQSEAAKLFGCDPDFDAWTGKKNPRPKADDPNLRSAGGHVHVGYPVEMLEPKKLVKYMDLCLGVPSVLMDAEGGRRRVLYGKPGAHRIKPYGVEYRTLSNFWVHHPALSEWVWRSTANAIDWAVNDHLNIDAYKTDIQTAINKNDKNAAWTMVKELGLEIVNV